MKVLSSALLLVVGMALVAGGCKKDDAPTATPATPAIPTELVAAWTTQGATLNGVTTPVGPALLRTKAKRASLNMVAAGTFAVQQFDSSNTNIFDLAGTVLVAGQKITLHGTSLDGAPVYDYDFVGPMTWSVSGNQLLTTFYSQTLVGTVVVSWTK